MKQTAHQALDAYYREGESWAYDRLAALRASRRVAWIVAAAAVVVAVFEATALIFLAPLKTVVPYTLLVDRHTGFVQALRPLDAQTLVPDNALIQSFLVQYVIARESFDIDGVQTAYRKVTLWSVQDARAEYSAAMQASNPASPLARYPRTTVVDARVKSVSPLGERSALVRFETQRRDLGGQASAPAAWVAVVRYRFSTRAQSTEDRYINPLGFQVFHYRRSAEALAPPERAVSAPPVVVVPGTVVRSYPPPPQRIAPQPAASPTLEVTL